MSSRAIKGNFYQRTKPFKPDEVKPLHYTFLADPNSTTNRRLIRDHSRPTAEFKAMKKQIGWIATRSHLKATIIRALSRIRLNAALKSA